MGWSSSSAILNLLGQLVESTPGLTLIWIWLTAPRPLTSISMPLS